MTDDADALLQATHRATFSGGPLTLVRWHQHLISPFGLCNGLLPNATGTALADLTIIRDQVEGHEVVVREVTASLGPSFRVALTEWARSLGYARVWFPDALVELDPSLPETASASTRCQVCGSHFSDSSLEFRLMVRANGVFPEGCPCCGASLPQWSVETNVADSTPTGSAVESR